MLNMNISHTNRINLQKIKIKIEYFVTFYFYLTMMKTAPLKDVAANDFLS